MMHDDDRIKMVMFLMMTIVTTTTESKLDSNIGLRFTSSTYVFSAIINKGLLLYRCMGSDRGLQLINC